ISLITDGIKCQAPRLIQYLLNNCTIALDHFTLLHLACSYNNTTIVALLLRYGADINFQDPDGETPLHTATQHKADAVIQYLLANGANSMIPNNNNQTPFYTACYYGSHLASLFFEHHSKHSTQNNDMVLQESLALC
ncbi:MAG TPA: ankyrin repeat domain-containing protein, partial [Legionellaceae bacterium]|nr:ankyrin repeat domain-containing protein [Legionellaceae bacterium]